jgi:(1->4)-alpha-D-glucan 1-alpha-D-glucosylmutase
MPDAPPRSVPAPRATYRLQFHAEFPFSAGAGLAGYLRDLGISHVYSSPILTARAGSQHGYDVVRDDAINPELGGEAGFRAMAEALREHGIGIVLDIVPNHVAVGGADNPVWLDLLKHGPASRHASWFDVDFEPPDAELRGKVHAPFLGSPYRELLERGELVLVEREGGEGFAIAYGEHLFPVRPQDEAEIAQAGLDTFREPERLDALIGRQNYLLDWWRNAGDRINWRRFFDITQLAAVRMEEPAAFDARHAVALGLYRDGLIDGLRIDHVDGLTDPACYCRQLRAKLDALQGERPEGLRDERAYLVVEKILASGEHIPTDWDVDGSTGYDFMDQVSALQHEPKAAPSLAGHWAVLSGRFRDFHGEEILARHQILTHSFDGQRERLVDALEAAGAEHRDGEGITRAALRRAVTSLIAQLRAYRGYVTGQDDGVGAGERVQAALESALDEPLSDVAALRFVASVIAGEGPESLRPSRIEAVRRFNQLAAPLAAKAVEDTAFYRYGRLISRNDVGFDAGVLGMAPEEFHALMALRAQQIPVSMLTTATHDHKRGEDVRARLAVISELPEEWVDATTRWFAANEAIRPQGLDPADEYMLYQTAIGAWPLDLAAEDGAGLAAFGERLSAWWTKALREAKLRSSWAAPNEAYEAKAAQFVAALFEPARSRAFLADAVQFVARIAPAGAANGLVQAALRCTVPGVPDLYQGCEYWDFSLVDPDNRRPVDFGARRIALAQHLTLDLLTESWRDGRIKQALLRKLLAARAREPALFAEGSYEPLALSGSRADNALAFLRRYEERTLLVVVARCCAAGLRNGLTPEADWWGDTTLALPKGLGGRVETFVGPDLPGEAAPALADLLTQLPVGAWVFSER